MIHFNSSKILIPVDFSETSSLALKHGAFIAQLTKGEVFLLHVINIHYMSQDLFLPAINFPETKDLELKAQDKLVQLAQQIKKDYGVRVGSIIKSGSPSSEIINVAKEIEASLIVMGTHGYSPMEELVIGSVALKVLTRAACPTMVMTEHATHKGYNKILLPIDTSAHTRQKVNYALEMAKKFSGVIYAVALLNEGEESEKAAIELIIHQIEVLAKEKDIAFHSEVLSNLKNRATATVKYSQQIGADLVVIMTDQDAELSGFFLGPYAQQVIHLSKVPVVAVKPAELGENNGSILSGTSGM